MPEEKQEATLARQRSELKCLKTGCENIISLTQRQGAVSQGEFGNKEIFVFLIS